MKTYELVLQRVEADLGAGRLRLGDRLPGERGLAESLGVSRATVREAIRVLEAMGVIRTGVGSGPDAGAVIVAEPSAALSSALRLHLATSYLPIRDIVRTRVLLESWSVAEAAAADSVDLARARALLDAMDDVSLDAEEFHRLDAAFHVELATVTGNVLIAAVMSALRQAIHGYVMTAVPTLDDWAATAAGLRLEHRAVLAAIEERRPDAAADLVTKHIEGFYRAARFG